MAAQAHKDIRILFTVGGRHYEAVGFLNDGEVSVDGDTMLSRTAVENGGTLKGEDEAFLREHRAELPSELTPYWLVTAERHPVGQRSLSCFNFYGGVWHHRWRQLDDHWFVFFLVVRRLP